MVEYESIIIDDLSNRIFSAYATVEVVDNQNDKILIDKFKKAFYKFLLRGATLSLGHTRYVIGRVLTGEESLDVNGNRAFKVVCQIYASDPENSIYDEVWEGVQSGKYKGLSVGGGIPRAILSVENGSTYNEYQTVPLMEISLVERPANPLALILGYSMAKSDYTNLPKKDGEVEKMDESKIIEKQESISSTPDKLDLILQKLEELSAKMPVVKEVEEETPVEVEEAPKEEVPKEEIVKEEMPEEEDKKEEMEKSLEVGVDAPSNEADKQPAVPDAPADVSDVEVADMKKSIEVLKVELESMKKSATKVTTPMAKTNETVQAKKSYWDLACEKKEKLF